MMLIRLTQAQLDKLADFFIGVALIFFASIVAPLFVDRKPLNLGQFLYAIIITILALVISLFIIRKKHDIKH